VYRCFHLIIMGVALDVNVSQARCRAAAEEHERGLAPFSPSRRFANHDILGDEDELALLLQDIVEPLQHSLSMLQKVRRHVLASPSLVASEEMQLLESADRHPAPSQKLLTSK